MKAEIYRCNLCGVAKGEVNHWFLGVNLPTSVIVTVWDERDAEVSTIYHLCGSACALKFESMWLSGHRGVDGKTAPLGASAEISSTEPQLGAVAGRPGTSSSNLHRTASGHTLKVESGT